MSLPSRPLFSRQLSLQFEPRTTAPIRPLRDAGTAPVAHEPPPGLVRLLSKTPAPTGAR